MKALLAYMMILHSRNFDLHMVVASNPLISHRKLQAQHLYCSMANDITRIQRRRAWLVFILTRCQFIPAELS